MLRPVHSPNGVNLCSFLPHNFVSAACRFASPHDLVKAMISADTNRFVLPIYERGPTPTPFSHLLVETHGMVALAAGDQENLLAIALGLYPGASNLLTREIEGVLHIGPEGACDNIHGLGDLTYAIVLSSDVEIAEAS